MHRATRPTYKEQYKSAIFAKNEQQLAVAEQSKVETSKTLKLGKIYTEIIPATTFYLAEDYHHKYMLRPYRGIVAEFKQMYPTLLAYVNSTAVTRANAFAGGYADAELTHKTIDQLGLSKKSRDKLLRLAERYW